MRDRRREPLGEGMRVKMKGEGDFGLLPPSCGCIVLEVLHGAEFF